MNRSRLVWPMRVPIRACQMQSVALTEHHGTEDAAIFPHLVQSQPILRDVRALLRWRPVPGGLRPGDVAR